MIANGLEDDLAGRNYAKAVKALKKREAITVWVLEMFDGRKGWTAIQAFAFSARLAAAKAGQHREPQSRRRSNRR